MFTLPVVVVVFSGHSVCVGESRDRMLEKKYFEHWRITVKMRQHQRTQMALGGADDDMELKNMGASAGMQNG